jgi:iron complex outermembrane recepter protein
MSGKRISKKVRAGLYTCVCTGVLLASPALAQVSPEKTYIVDLPALRLDRSLTQLARQTHISIDFSTFNLKAIKHPAVLGLFTLEDALSAVLKDTAYTFAQVGPGAYRIVLAQKQVTLATTKPAIPKVTIKLFPDETIIVRATKRAGVASRLPMSISVTDSDELEMLQITDTNALATHTAGMSSTNLGPSRNKIFIRGISDGSFTGRQQATIGAYLDNIRLNYNEPDPYLQLEDVDHVEVLRGPQGTLYGAGSLGGLYRVITNAPDLGKYSATLNLGTSLTRNGGQNGRISATINLPLVSDTLAFRITGYLNHTAGYIDDIRLEKNNVNTTNVFGTRARILLNIGENWQINAGLNFQDVIADDTQYFINSLGPYKRDNYVKEPHEDDFINPYADIKAAYHWGDFVSSTSLVHRTIGDEVDASTAVPIIAALPTTPSVFKMNRTINMITNETRLVSRSGGRFDWLVGGFISQRHETYGSTLTIPGSAPSLVGGAINGDVAFREGRRERTNEIAAFGETTLHLPLRLDLTTGLRWFHSAERTRALIDGSLGTKPVLRAGKSKDKGFTPKIVLSYQLNDQNLLYVQRTEGYRPGGINLNSPDSVFFENDETDKENGKDLRFEPDKLKMYETGGKFELADGRLQVDISAFTFKWNDIQSDQILPDGFSFILNAGYIRSRGVELDVRVNPMPGLNIDGNIAFNDADLVIANPFLGANPNNQLPSIPQLAGGVSAEYTWAAWADNSWHFGADFSYTGNAHLTFSSLDNRHSQRTKILNARLALENPSHWQASVYVRNITNEKANTFAFGNPFSFRQRSQHTPPVPQTFGIAFSRTF